MIISARFVFKNTSYTIIPESVIEDYGGEAKNSCGEPADLGELNERYMTERRSYTLLAGMHVSALAKRLMRELIENSLNEEARELLENGVI